ncbi:hypothetical protein B0I72DRAFT_162841 [Yarrowia lipolytica]|jgi:dual specificity MAP kinase phosphatase|uniref:YALI0B04290p n=2 Tax=Yarrowia lipolytica TaxID=4952 RepID=Q6CFS4_YARLI|nr:YALI0B04290p [Yarrowia lipolytica CLIB122]AOW01203.1 hypothetical protein YALI1_B05762g [Yarrowia lipolytica]KAB8285308.1 hypothetical protein BKA91DRAFT_163900 [Yarrowia lipolytica]KAE8174932.1 hypothetical protein BKA90DRAFT_106944 [Yarrowia lipolytica]KAJ8052087.1 hypothetical protein LXG23DRAFT_50171 [Yarrowia lipolytica]RDW27088.1 hypothetical protein B0I71DRAFT_158010 [Yarrowia lipolytica]|eukprot:XP_500488.1 YALI0B04290p [Yarrowia lipolytica CLIB122]
MSLSIPLPTSGPSLPPSPPQNMSTLAAACNDDSGKSRAGSPASVCPNSPPTPPFKEVTCQGDMDHMDVTEDLLTEREAQSQDAPPHDTQTAPPTPAVADAVLSTSTSALPSPPLRKSALLDSANWSILTHSPPVIGIDTKTLVDAIDFHYSTRLPRVDKMFPWLHGLHPSNVNQRTFLHPNRRVNKEFTTEFIPNNSSFPVSQAPGASTPLPSHKDIPSEVRGLIIVKANRRQVAANTPVQYNGFGHAMKGETLREARHSGSIIGTIFLEDFLEGDAEKEDFQDKFKFLDAPEGISLRKFQIQVAKWAVISDIVLYDSAEGLTPRLLRLAEIVSGAQRRFAAENEKLHQVYRTFVFTDSITQLEQEAPHTVTMSHNLSPDEIDEQRLKNWDANLLFHERVEISMMSTATPIACDVWLGNTTDFDAYTASLSAAKQAKQVNKHHGDIDAAAVKAPANWVTIIDCQENARLVPLAVLDQYIREAEACIVDPSRRLSPLQLGFPSSGSIPIQALTPENVYSIINVCKLIYLRSKCTYGGKPAASLVFCNDGYTETSLLALIFLMYSTGCRAPQAWVDLHVQYKRPFFCFPIDVTVASALQTALHKYSPALNEKLSSGAEYTGMPPNLMFLSDDEDNGSVRHEDSWFNHFDGSVPSRILPHLYLGSLDHASNHGLIQKLGIKRILSVGEPVPWAMAEDADEDEEIDLEEEARKVAHDPDLVKLVRQTQERREARKHLSRVLYVSNIQDDGIDEITDSLAQCLDFLDEGYRLGEMTLVHCRVGVSRSATVCIAEVMKRLGVGLPRAYLFVRVRRLNVIIQPNLRLMYELVKWEERHRDQGEGWLREVDWHILCREIANMNRVYIPE